MDFDELVMMRCLSLAAMGNGFVSPNPMVGAVLVHDRKIIGEGYHQKYGEAHAEVNAVQSVADELKYLIPSSTLFVNLEPCNHFGKTPPCTDMIIRNGIKKIVAGTGDPNTDVSGGGFKKLRENGVEVISGVLQDECIKLNKFFFTASIKKRPFITIKWAQSSDGYIASESGKPVHFTNSTSDMMVHKMRSEHASILIGGNTVSTDNPQLTVRNWKGPNPLRIIITNRDLDLSSKIFDSQAETIIFYYGDEITSKYIRLDNNSDIALQVVTALHNKKINSILIEGGAKTIDLFIKAGLWDEAKIFISGDVMNQGIKAPAIPGDIISTEEIFGQLLITAKPS